MKNKIKFFHIRRNDGSAMTVATEVQDDGYLKMGFAFCNSKDPFVKKTGRIKALGRLKSKYYEITQFTDHSGNDVVRWWNQEPTYALHKSVEVPHSWRLEVPHSWRHGSLIHIKQTGLEFVANA